MNTLPILNMAGWSILDYELAFDGIRQVSNASLWLQNQPRALSSKTDDYYPGAAFIVDIGESWCAQVHRRTDQQPTRDPVRRRI